MYTLQTKLTEQIALVEEVLQVTNQNEKDQLVLIPDTNAEIIIPIKQDLIFRHIGGVRPLVLEKGCAYFMMPRRRGAELSTTSSSNGIIIKVNPIFARKIASQSVELSNGVFQLKFNKEQIADVISAESGKDIYYLSDLLEGYFRDNNELHEYNETILGAMEQIENSSGTISIKEIYSNLNVSKSKLEQHFNKEIGLTPKEYCKIKKINCFISSYQENREVSLTELTYQCGYYDQSHLIKDFKYFLDTSPKKFLSQL